MYEEGVKTHLRAARLGVVEVEVNDVTHLMATAVHIPVMPVKWQRAAKPAGQPRQRAA